MTFEDLLIHKFFFKTRYSSQNSIGEYEYTVSSTSTGYDCRISPISAMERREVTGRYDDVKYKCFCPSSTNILSDTKIAWGNNDYRVKEVIIDSSGHHKTAYLVQVA